MGGFQMKKCKIAIIIGVMIMLQLAFTAIALGEGNTFILPEFNLNKITGIVDVDFKYSSSYDSAIKSGFQVKLVGTELTASTDNRGYFEICNVPKNAAEYTLKISKIGYLAREIKISDAQLSKQINIIEIWAGDLPDNNLQDGIVNLKDIMSMAKSFNATYESSDYDEYKDFNKDKAINMVDILVIAKHFNATSDSYPAIEDSAVNSIEVVNEYTIKVTFSKDMQLTPGATSPKDGDASNKIYYTIKNNDGKIITISNATYSVADRTTTIILLEKQLGECIIYIGGIKDASGQEMKPEMNVIKFYDVTPPSVERVYHDNINKNKMLVVYNEEMATEGPFSVLLPENYKWDNDISNGIFYEALPAGSSIKVSPTDSKAVIITLGPGGETTSYTALQFGYISGTVIKALADKAGNIIINLGKVQTVELQSLATIINSELAITSDNSLRVKVLGPKLSEVSADDFRYTITDRESDNFTPLSAKLVDVDNMQYIEFTVPQDTFGFYTDLSKVCVKTSANPQGTKTALGTSIAENIVSPVAIGTLFRTYIKSVSIYDWDSAVVKLEGKINASELNNLISSIRLYQGPYQININGSSLIGSVICSNIIMITTSGQIDKMGSVLLRTLPLEYMTVKDFNGQYFKENTDGVSGIAVFMASKVSTTGISGQRVKNGDSITIDFNMVPKGVVSASIESDGAGKAKVIIEGVGTITGLTLDNYFTGVTINAIIKGKQIVITFNDLPDGINLAYGAANTMKFVPYPGFVNSAHAPIDTDVTPIF